MTARPSPRFTALVAAVGELDATVLAQAVPRCTCTHLLAGGATVVCAACDAVAHQKALARKVRGVGGLR